MSKSFSENLHLQYKMFRVIFWVDFLIASFLVAGGKFELGLLFALFALLSGSVANQKAVLINQEKFLVNQELVLNKLDTLLEEGVQ